jgi:hypothetical protein
MDFPVMGAGFGLIGALVSLFQLITRGPATVKVLKGRYQAFIALMALLGFGLFYKNITNTEMARRNILSATQMVERPTTSQQYRR